MLDKNRVYGKIDQLNTSLEELDEIKPATFEEYVGSITTKYACERLLQISIEACIDICQILAANLALGLPSDDEALLDKLEANNVLSVGMKNTLKGMMGFRNILVHKYGDIDDDKAFDNLSRLADFEAFKSEVVSFIANYKPKNGKKTEK